MHIYTRGMYVFVCKWTINTVFLVFFFSHSRKLIMIEKISFEVSYVKLVWIDVFLFVITLKIL